MHFANDPAYGLMEGNVESYVRDANAKFDNYIVKATRKIHTDDEILISYYGEEFHNEIKEENQKKRKAINSKKSRENKKFK